MRTSDLPCASERELKLLLYGLLSLGALLSLGPLLVGSARLPDPLAIHWSLQGVPDASLPKRQLLIIPVLLLGPALILNGLMSGAPTPTRARSLIPLTAFVAVLCAILTSSVVALNWQHHHWQAADRVTVLHGLSALLVPAACGFFGRLFAVRRWPALPVAEARLAPTLILAKEERIYWSGSASNYSLLLLPLISAPALLFIVMQQQPPSGLWAFILGHVFLLLLLELFCKVRVSVGERGLRVRYGHLGWWSTRHSLEQIAEASTLDLVPLDFGGWGYRRCSGRRTAVVVRAGEALRLVLRGGRQWLITVDDAKTAASLIEGLLARARPDSESVEAHGKVRSE